MRTQLCTALLPAPWASTTAAVRSSIAIFTAAADFITNFQGRQP